MTELIKQITLLLRTLADLALQKGAISAEAATAIHMIASEADGGITGKQATRLRLSPLRYCKACGEWVMNPCSPDTV